MPFQTPPASPLPDAGRPEPAPPDGVLDAAALAALRSLDPTGAGKLLERVLAAFESSTSRLVVQLHTARVGADAESVKHVAHTLKSSSASIGAVKLSQLCAEIEAMLRNGQTLPALDARLAALEGEIAAALGALRSVLRDGR